MFFVMNLITLIYEDGHENYAMASPADTLYFLNVRNLNGLRGFEVERVDVYGAVDLQGTPKDSGIYQLSFSREGCLEHEYMYFPTMKDAANEIVENSYGHRYHGITEIYVYEKQPEGAVRHRKPI